MANERLISVPKLVIELAKRYNRSASNNGLICYDAVMATIADAPSVDAVEVVRGRWVFDDDGDPYCSVCRKCAGLLCIEFGNYCPKCGAKMDGGNE